MMTHRFTPLTPHYLLSIASCHRGEGRPKHLLEVDVPQIELAPHRLHVGFVGPKVTGKVTFQVHPHLLEEVIVEVFEKIVKVKVARLVAASPLP